jgi:predicted GH43/DUF377 family glycosyl hydrolase
MTILSLRRLMIGLLATTLLLAAGSSLAQDTANMTVEISPEDDNPALPVGEEGAFDAVSVRLPNVVYHEEQFHMFYTSYTDPTTPQAIGYAVSADGINWERAADGPVFEGSGDEDTFDQFGVNSPSVLVEADGTWVMYYNGNPAPGLPTFGTSIGRATASDPTGPWQRAEEPVLEAGEAGEFDANFIFPGSVLAVDGEYVMYFSANGAGNGTVGRATSSNGVEWEKSDAPVLEAGDPDDWDFLVAWGPGVAYTGERWEMTYTGGTTIAGTFTASLGYAYSTNGLEWVKYPDNPVIEVDGYSTLFTSLAIVDDTHYVYYGLTPTDGSAFTEIHAATGTVSSEE